MDTSYTFLIGLTLATVLGFAVAIYLKMYLKGILVDLCGTAARADFWMAFSNVTLVLLPMVFAMQFNPNTSQNLPTIFQLNFQLKWVLVGLISSVMALGAVLSIFIMFSSPKPENS